MKLIFCPRCQDVVRLTDRSRICLCGNSWGRYTDDTNAEIGGDAVPLGISNPSFKLALKNRPVEGQGSRFEAFVIPVECPTVKFK